MIEYYRKFLTCLIASPRLQRQDLRFYSGGTSLGGFELDPQNRPAGIQHLPLTLREQISLTYQRLRHATIALKEQLGTTDQWPEGPLRVILVGHSVGTYMILELLAQRRRELKKMDASINQDYSIIGAISLFPTIVDLTKSPNGRKVGLFASMPGVSLLCQTVAKLICYTLPESSLLSLVRRLTDQPAHAAEITAAFLRSSNGVRQAVFMGQHELLEITADQWDDDLWGATDAGNASTGSDRPKLYFFWGENDHWTDDGVRDAVVARRARTASDGRGTCKPFMEVDTGGIPHDFCISK